MTDRQTDIR